MVPTLTVPSVGSAVPAGNAADRAAAVTAVPLLPPGGGRTVK